MLQYEEPAGRKATTDVFRWALPAVLLLTAILYSHGLFNGLTSFDDYSYIVKNPFLKEFSLKSIRAIFTSTYEDNYHPFTSLVFLLEHTFFGIKALPYHFVDLLLHLLNTWLVFKLAERLSGNRVTGLVVSTLFAIHPMHVESVAWVSATKDTLYAAFYLASLLVYLRYISSGFKWWAYVAALFLFLCSLFSKSAAVTLPVLLIAIDLYKGRKIAAGMFLEKIPFFTLSLVFGIVNLMAQQSAMADLNSTYNAINRLFLFTGSLSFYLVKLVAPFGLSVLHFFPGVAHGALPWLYYASLPFLLLVVWLVVRSKAYRKELLFGSLFFLIAISVMLQIVPVGSALVSERYTYIPYIGLFYIAGQWVAGTGWSKYRKATAGVAAIILLVFAVQTWLRIGVWKNDATLYGDLIKKDTPHANGISMGFFQLGGTRKANGDLQGAEVAFTQSILFCPQYENAYFNRGLIYYSLGNLDAAIADYTSVIDLDPKLALVYNYRAQAYQKQGNAGQAIADYNSAILLEPSNAELYNNRGGVYYATGNKKMAMDDYNKAISVNPNFAGGYTSRAWSYYQAGDIAAAITDYDKAIAVDPGNSLAYGNLGAIKSNTGDLAGAIAAYDSLVKIDPKDNTSYYMLGIIHLNQKDTAGACSFFKTAASLGNTNAGQMVQRYCH